MEFTESIQKGMTAQMIENLMRTLLEQQLTHQKNGKYIQAQQCKNEHEENRKRLEKRKAYEMDQRHKQQFHEINQAHNQQLNSFNRFWDQKLNEYNNQGTKSIQQLENKHHSEIQKLKNQLNQQLPLKVKQSSDLLNLRKMEDHMAKQKNYLQAHKVQAKANQMYQLEKANWLEARNNKINTAVNNLKVKQASQMATLKKRVTAGQQQQKRQRHFEQLRLKQKYENICKDLKSQQDKQILFFKGQFKSKGGSPQLSPTKTS